MGKVNKQPVTCNSLIICFWNCKSFSKNNKNIIIAWERKQKGILCLGEFNFSYSFRSRSLMFRVISLIILIFSKLMQARFERWFYGINYAKRYRAINRLWQHLCKQWSINYHWLIFLGTTFKGLLEQIVIKYWLVHLLTNIRNFISMPINSQKVPRVGSGEYRSLRYES